tara:strand:- start:168 stop:284 length:117 start_codon:yes stop_codon:yes gene_type:complete
MKAELTQDQQFFMNLFVTMIAVGIVWDMYDRYKAKKEK